MTCLFAEVCICRQRQRLSDSNMEVGVDDVVLGVWWLLWYAFTHLLAACEFMFNEWVKCLLNFPPQVHEIGGEKQWCWWLVARKKMKPTGDPPTGLKLIEKVMRRVVVGWDCVSKGNSPRRYLFNYVVVLNQHTLAINPPLLQTKLILHVFAPTSSSVRDPLRISY